MNRRDFLTSVSIMGAGMTAVSGIPAWSKVIENRIPIVDTHLHLWDRSAMDYPWLSGVLDRDFFPKDFQEASKSLPVSKMVFVECGRRPEQYLTEVDWVISQAKQDPRIRGMVAYFPLERGLEAEKEMEQLVSRGIVKGIRRGVSEELLESTDFLQGVKLMGIHGLSYDLNITPPLMGPALDFVRRFPQLTFVLNHIANPDIKGGAQFDHWKRYMSHFGKLDHVVCKVSGLITKADPQSWTSEDLKPYMEQVFAAFDAERLVFGGDWPVVLRAGSYMQWAEVFFEYTDQLSDEEKADIFHRNAERIYRI
ncbi:MAG: amidohydrolase family protein [Lunatimonas sp.]|uniref:amidohydrolase family protein n=1 Tax=Lunatimonas sp. TaxID=2060141 RepID=UPI00263A5BFA|nr:amidohydrolase family protein [Lunatimonas sp.]MCC5939031.1 amidohydrolase family protein [Lunatimonas sp.]